MPDPQSVKKVFSAAAIRYNLTNSVITGGLDGLWRRNVAKRVAMEHPRVVLDLACGSGALTFAVARKLARRKVSSTIIGIDFTEEFLPIARHDAEKMNFAPVKLDFQQGDAMAMKIGSESIDAITLGFGLRNFESRHQGYAEMWRVLKPGGKVFILETSQPIGLMKPLTKLYLPMIPFIATLLGTDGEAYKHLINTMRTFPPAETISAELQAAGFGNVGFQRLMGGVATIHWGTKNP